MGGGVPYGSGVDGRPRSGRCPSHSRASRAERQQARRAVDTGKDIDRKARVVPQRRRNLKMHGNSILITGGGPASAVAWRRLLESPMVDITQTFLAIYPSASDKIYWGRVAG